MPPFTILLNCASAQSLYLSKIAFDGAFVTAMANSANLA
jgi:hypothetical protein